MGASSDDLETLRGWIDGYDRIVVGAGAGLSAAAGMVYGGERFRANFPDFIAKYHYGDMYTASFQKYASPEEHWAYWSRHIMLNRYMFEDNGTYADLLSLVKGKDYFVVTSNVDHCFQRTGFDKSRLFYMQGDYGLWQCSVPCHRSTYDNEAAVRQMCARQRDMMIPTELVPHCPRCGAPMTMNLRVDGRFVEDEGWHTARERYIDFLEGSLDRDVLFLELGVGYNTPGIIKYPFWSMASDNQRSRYACISLGAARFPVSLEGRAVGLDADIREVLHTLAHP